MIFRGYPKMAEKLIELAHEQPGFIGIEACYMEGFSLAVTYWHSLESIQQWRENSVHLAAKNKAEEQWFSKYMTRIAKVEKAY